MRNNLLRASIIGVAPSTYPITGTVKDPKGAVVAGAAVNVKNVVTNLEYTTETSNDGTFSFPALSTGVYTVTINATGFRQAVVSEIKIDVSITSSIQNDLEAGAAPETVTVVGGGELLHTQTATVGTTLTGRQSTGLPAASRNVLDLVLAMPCTTTVGRLCQSSVNGLPGGTHNITLDGIDVQDNLLKSKVKFITQGGTNDFHGGSIGITATRRSTQITGSTIATSRPLPKLFDERDEAFFFVNYEEYRLPERTA